LLGASAFSWSFRPSRDAARAGIHNHRPWVWIPNTSRRIAARCGCTWARVALRRFSARGRASLTCTCDARLDEDERLTALHRGGDPLLELLLRRRADLTRGHLAGLENHQRRDRLDRSEEHTSELQSRVD